MAGFPREKDWKVCAGGERGGGWVAGGRGGCADGRFDKNLIFKISLFNFNTESMQ